MVAYFGSLEWDKQSDGGEEGGEKKKKRSKKGKEKKEPQFEKVDEENLLIAKSDQYMEQTMDEPRDNNQSEKMPDVIYYKDQADSKPIMSFDDLLGADAKPQYQKPTSDLDQTLIAVDDLGCQSRQRA